MFSYHMQTCEVPKFRFIILEGKRATISEREASQYSKSNEQMLLGCMVKNIVMIPTVFIY